MKLDWIRERAPVWDNSKARIVGEAKTGVFDDRYRALKADAPVPGEWWRVELDGTIAGYGWLEIVWGDAEILLATDADHRGKGVGTFALDNLCDEAHQRGLNYVCNIIRPTHPNGNAVHDWLVARGFSASTDGRLVRRSEARGTGGN